ncbi:hypothetical protein [Halorubrum lacusprofundi]|uniref:hypothetical protein n=1 Tax=Halorubrum lacusprofundi TaxID=2247 RepID=UPI001F1DAB2C|nr:hypothetical protein [Halorubrum lacusprofundi]MCG1006329.1 hypothetical protein [Halorubrum lacusprofundi]
MNEPAVFGHVVTALNERNYEPLVHVPEAHSDAYADVLDRWSPPRDHDPRAVPRRAWLHRREPRVRD